MQISSTLCRAREAHHLALAAGSTLANVSTVATLAAAAWAKEAHAAEVRENRVEKRRASEALLLAQPLAEARGFSENPDRGHAEG